MHKIQHPFEPLYNENSKILILGSFPSVKSREQNFYYGHPQNRFWKVLSSIFDEKAPNNISEKKTMLFEHNIALWDVIKICDIEGSSDNSIKNVIPNDIKALVDKTHIEKIYCNGKTAAKYYDQYQKDRVGLPMEVLPSTSPANAVYTLERLLDKWKVIVDK